MPELITQQPDMIAAEALAVLAQIVKTDGAKLARLERKGCEARGLVEHSGLSPRTVRYAHTVLRRALKQAVRWGMIPRNPCDDTDPPKVSRDEMRPLDRRQARRLLSAARSDSDRLEAL